MIYEYHTNFNSFIQMSVLMYAWYNKLRVRVDGFQLFDLAFGSLSRGPKKITSDFAKRAFISFVY